MSLPSHPAAPLLELILGERQMLLRDNALLSEMFAGALHGGWDGGGRFRSCLGSALN